LASQYGAGKYVIYRTVSDAITALANYLGESQDYWQMLQKNIPHGSNENLSSQ
jgi:hypothetical protein